jgi:hypothetical protein
MTLGSTLLVLIKWFTMQKPEELEKKDENTTPSESPKDSSDTKEVPVKPPAGDIKITSIIGKLGEAGDYIKKINN